MKRRRPILRRPGRLKRWLYKRGHRPKPGTILYSPSLSMIYAWRDYEEHPDYPADCRDTP